jgi:glycosyltransferase involved in cell wall biosynthesis
MKLPSVIYLLGSDSAGIRSINFGILHKPFVSTVVKWAYGKASLVLAISKFQKDSLLSHGINRTIHVIPWGADRSMYKFVGKTRHTVLNFIHVGHLSPVKDQGTLLRAFAGIVRHHAAELRIFGEDVLNGEMQRLCAELQIEKHVQFRDIIAYVDMPEQYAWADIMLHTSLSEGQSMALTEAAACGVLLAGTRVGLLYDLGDEYAITVEPGDHQALASKLITFLSKPIEWERKIQLARKWSQDHDLRWTVSEINKLLLSL